MKKRTLKSGDGKTHHSILTVAQILDQPELSTSEVVAGVPKHRFAEPFFGLDGLKKRWRVRQTAGQRRHRSGPL